MLPGRYSAEQNQLFLFDTLAYPVCIANQMFYDRLISPLVCTTRYNKSRRAVPNSALCVGIIILFLFTQRQPILNICELFNEDVL